MRITVTLFAAVATLATAQWSPRSFQKCGGSLGEVCAPNQYCLTAKSGCTRGGVCVSRPSVCHFDRYPVCGCDGRTYKSSCDAHKNGVSISEYNPCKGASVPVEIAPPPMHLVPLPPMRPRPPPRNHDSCGIHKACKDGQYCYHSKCRSEVGRCINVPHYCPNNNTSPVCGCDGFTYSSFCEAARAQASIQSRGACVNLDPSPPAPPVPPAPVERCKVGAGASCSDPHAMCVGRMGDCRKYSIGTCWVPDQETSCQLQKVCGCSGSTYSSPCQAKKWGDTIRHIGACDNHTWAPPPLPPPLKPFIGADCEDEDDCDLPSLFCSRAAGQCDGKGTCQERSAKYPCDKGNRTVCGCDGATYGNECEADLAGTSVAGYGDCEVATEEPGAPDGSCRSGADCGDDEYCNFDYAMCGDDGAYGECRKTPSKASCPVFRMAEMEKARAAAAQGARSVLPPPRKTPWWGWSTYVCGCDGSSYMSSCYAHTQGISVRHRGKCNQKMLK